MLKKTISYVDYDGNKRTEDFYFNLTKAELVEMDMSETGGLDRLIKKIIAEQDTARIVEMFKKIIFQAYGEKSLDGKRFIKSKDLSEAFSQTEAYSELFMELISDANAAAAFVGGIIPAEVSANAKSNTIKMPGAE